MATIHDVARVAGVSVATVSHVINGTRKVNSETQARVRRAIEELGYQPNAIARSLRKRVTYAIGVLVSDITNPFFAHLVRGVEDAAHTAGYSVIVCNSDENPEKEDFYIRNLWRRRIDGMLIAPTRDGTSSALQELVQKGITLVFIDRKAKGIEAPAVLSDNVGGAYLATKHLIERGHKKIGVALGIPGATTTEERFTGYCLALKEAGIPFSEELVVWGGYRVEGGREAARALLSLSKRPTAIFSTNNLMTIGILQELFSQQIEIPHQMAVVSFDDLEWAEITDPPLTAVAQRPYEIGRKAFELLLELMGNLKAHNRIKEIRIPVELKFRRSS